MLKSYRIIREAAERIAIAAEGTVPELRDGRLDRGPAFTERMLGRIAYAMDGHEHKGIVWRARTVTTGAEGGSSGPAAGAGEGDLAGGDDGGASSRLDRDADFLGVVDVSLPGYRITKGFLARGRLIASGEPVSTSDFEELKEGCERMLSRSPASFLFLYSREGVHVVPALAVVSSSPMNPHRLYPRIVERFYEEHLSCFFGDRRIAPPDIASLKAACGDLGARHALGLEARETPGGPETLF